MKIAEPISDPVKPIDSALLLDALKEASLNLESLEASVKMVKRRLDEHIAELDY